MSRGTYLHCTYAEDVRPEVSGQFSIIGVYHGGLKVTDGQTSLPKLVVISDLHFPAQEIPSSLKLEVISEGRVLQVVQPPADFIGQVKSAPDASEQDGYLMQFVVGFIGFPVEKTTTIEVKATVDNYELRGNTLRIVVESPTSEK